MQQGSQIRSSSDKEAGIIWGAQAVHRDFGVCVGDMEELYRDDIGDPSRLAIVITTNSKT